ncbi:MAG: hypothetical protein RLY71_4617, partial [Pseudomonadota bacterium]
MSEPHTPDSEITMHPIRFGACLTARRALSELGGRLAGVLS